MIKMPFALNEIKTTRLSIRLISSEVLSLIIRGEAEQAGHLLGVPIPVELLRSLSSLSYSQKELNKDEAYLPWSARAVFLRDNPQFIGIIRFHSVPRPIGIPGYQGDAVELGYRIFEAFRNRGYAREAADAMMYWANTQFGIRNFLASVAPGNMASNPLIWSFNFKKVAEVIDESDGLEYVYLRQVNG